MANTIFLIFFAMWSLGNIICIPYVFYLALTGKLVGHTYKVPTWIQLMLLVTIVGIIGSLISSTFLVK